jgi:hypothetical protein
MTNRAPILVSLPGLRSAAASLARESANDRERLATLRTPVYTAAKSSARANSLFAWHAIGPAISPRTTARNPALG